MTITLGIFSLYNIVTNYYSYQKISTQNQADENDAEYT